jgi:hypothetical protein
MLKERKTINIDQKQLLGEVEDWYDQMGIKKDFHWMSFFHGWMESRIALLGTELAPNRCDTCEFKDKFMNKHIVREPYVCTRDAEGPETIEGCIQITFSERANIIFNGCPFWKKIE